MRWMRALVALSMFSGLLLAVGFNPQPAFAADQVVGGGVHPCTRDGLAGAIADAATTNPNNPGIVTFDCDTPTITFAAGDVITISAVVTIDGSNAGNPIILDANHTTNFFIVTDDADLTFTQVTMQKGGNATIQQGGAIDVDHSGTLTLIGVTFIDNQAGYGGVIDNYNGLLTISQSNFIDNQGDFGGAIWNGNSLTISQSSFVNNHATVHGGAIELTYGSAEITTSTFSGNTAVDEGSTISVHPETTSTNISWSTIVQIAPEATEALYLEGDLTLTGVILDGHGDHCAFDGGDLTHSFTLTNHDSCAPNTTASWENQNLLLGPLSTTTINNVEQTYYSLLADSPALDSGPTSCDTDVLPEADPDQLGYPRPGNTNCSIGAIESNNLPPVIAVAAPPIVINEGEPIDFAANISDPDNDPLTSTIDCDLSDDAPPVPGTSCTYLDNGNFSIWLVVSDDFSSDAVRATITVNNVVPLMNSIVPSAYLVVVNQPLSIQLSATDTRADTIQFTYNCGDANPITTPSISSTDGTFITTVVCQFPQPSPYILHALATDDDDGVSAQIASDPIYVINPSTLCANSWNGQLRMIEDAGDCNRSEILIELPAHGPLDLCVNHWNSATRADLHHQGCSRDETQVRIENTGAIPICVNKWNGTLRVTTHCTRSEYADTL